MPRWFEKFSQALRQSIFFFSLIITQGCCNNKFDKNWQGQVKNKTCFLSVFFFFFEKNRRWGFVAICILFFVLFCVYVCVGFFFFCVWGVWGCVCFVLFCFCFVFCFCFLCFVVLIGRWHLIPWRLSCMQKKEKEASYLIFCWGVGPSSGKKNPFVKYCLNTYEECFSHTHPVHFNPFWDNGCFCFHCYCYFHCYLWKVFWLQFNSKLLNT